MGAYVCPKGYQRTANLDYLLAEVAPKAKLMAHRADAFIEAEVFPVNPVNLFNFYEKFRI